MASELSPLEWDGPRLPRVKHRDTLIAAAPPFAFNGVSKDAIRALEEQELSPDELLCAVIVVAQRQLGNEDDDWVPLSALHAVAELLDRPLVDVYDVILLRAGSLGSKPATPRRPEDLAANTATNLASVIKVKNKLKAAQRKAASTAAVHNVATKKEKAARAAQARAAAAAAREELERDTAERKKRAAAAAAREALDARASGHARAHQLAGHACSQAQQVADARSGEQAAKEKKATDRATRAQEEMAAAAWSTAPWHAKAHAAREALVDDIVRLLPPQPSGKPAKRPTDPGHDERWGRPKPVEDLALARARAVRLRANAQLGTHGNCRGSTALSRAAEDIDGVKASVPKDEPLPSPAPPSEGSLALQAALALNPKLADVANTARGRGKDGRSGGAAVSAAAATAAAAAAAAAAAPSSPSPPSSPDTSARPSSSAAALHPSLHRSSHGSSSPSSSPTALAARGRGALGSSESAPQLTIPTSSKVRGRPPALRQTLPDGFAERAPRDVAEAALEFDRRHHARATSGEALLEVCRVDLESAAAAEGFERLVQEVRWNRFVAPQQIREVRRYKAKAKKAKLWKLDQSIWAPRRVWADARHFVDTDEALRKALRRDWGRAVEERGLGRYIAKRDDDGAEDADGDGVCDEVDEVFDELASHGGLMYSLFDYYCAQGALKACFSVTPNGWKDFCRDCSLADKSSKDCNTSALSTLFVIVNAGGSNPLAGGGDQARANAAQRSPQKGGAVRPGSGASSGGKLVKDHALNRHEWLEIVVRTAIARYVLPRVVRDVSEAVRRLIADDVKPRVDSAALQDSNAFRLHCCYTAEVDGALRRHEESLRNMFERYAGGDSRHDASSPDAALMGIDEWREFILDLGLLDDAFTQREVTLSFLWARMRSHDEQTERGWKRTTNLTFEDFLEAFVRVATLKAMPTDAMIEAAGAADAGELLLGMQGSDGQGHEYKAFVAANVRQWDTALKGELGQPVARCVEHLATLMVRTVKRELSVAGHVEPPPRRASIGGGSDANATPVMRISRKESIAFDMARGAANR